MRPHSRKCSTAKVKKIPGSSPTSLLHPRVGSSDVTPTSLPRVGSSGVTQGTGNTGSSKTVIAHRNYRCLLCDKTFTSMSHLRVHNRIHTGEKPYCCIICEKPFRERGHLIKHTRTHTGEKPFRCPTCGKAFGDDGNLARHKRIHIGDKPHECHICYRVFSQKEYLRQHRRVHITQQHCCFLCGKSYNDPKRLFKHKCNRRRRNADDAHRGESCYQRSQLSRYTEIKESSTRSD